MPRRLTTHEIEYLADQLTQLAVVLGSRGQERRPLWVTIEEMTVALDQHGVRVDPQDVEYAIAYAVGAGKLKAQGAPPHAVAPVMH